MTAIQIQNLCFAYPERKLFRSSQRVPLLLENVNLEIKEGKTLALLGCSGVGKSTLLRLIAGLLTPTSGRIVAFGSSPDVNRKQGKIGFVPQSRHLMPWMSVRENVLYPSPPLGCCLTLSDLARTLGITSILECRPARLSGGQQSRAALARALIRKPSLLLLDEPFSSVDPLRREKLWKLLEHACKNGGTTVIFTTHDVREALAVANHIAILSKPAPAEPARVSYTLESDPVLQLGRQEQAVSAEEVSLRDQLSEEVRGLE